MLDDGGRLLFLLVHVLLLACHEFCIVEVAVFILVVLLQNAVNYGNNLLYAKPVLRITGSFIRSFIMMIVLIIVFVFLLHSGDGFQQLQTIQLMIVVSVVLSEVLHQQLGVVQTVDIHVVLLHLGLDVLSLPVQVDVDVLMFRLVSPPLSSSRGLSGSWAASLRGFRWTFRFMEFDFILITS